MDDIQFMVIDADGWGRVTVLSHDLLFCLFVCLFVLFCFVLCCFLANVKPEVLAGISEASYELLYVLG